MKSWVFFPPPLESERQSQITPWHLPPNPPSNNLIQAAGVIWMPRFKADKNQLSKGSGALCWQPVQRSVTQKRIPSHWAFQFSIPLFSLEKWRRWGGGVKEFHSIKPFSVLIRIVLWSEEHPPMLGNPFSERMFLFLFFLHSMFLSKFLTLLKSISHL